jgi:transglutaminase/protease-like cytokinesis protein 3
MRLFVRLYCPIPSPETSKIHPPFPSASNIASSSTKVSSPTHVYRLRSEQTKPIEPINYPKTVKPVNHFRLTKRAESKAQANKVSDFHQAIRGAEACRKASPLVPEEADDQTSVLPQDPFNPALTNFSHVPIPESGIRNQFHNTAFIPDDHPY